MLRCNKLCYSKFVCRLCADAAAEGVDMYIVDDPTLALIARFVGGLSNSEFSDAEFFRQQVAAIADYVGKFPPEERDLRALAWIEANARQYRQQWQKHVAVNRLAMTRCADCPLTGGDKRIPCAIHSRWLALLRRYAADELSSHEYVTKTLGLLTAHKDWLRVSDARHSLPSPRQAVLNPEVEATALD